MGGLCGAVRTVGVGQLFPAADARGEVLERQCPRLIEQEHHELAQFGTATRIRAGLAERPSLTHPDAAVVQRLDHLGDIIRQPGEPQSFGHVRIGPAELGTEPSPQRPMAVHPAVALAAGRGEQRRHLRLHPARLGLEFVQTGPPLLGVHLARPLTQLCQHTAMFSKGCIEVPLLAPTCQARPAS